MTNYFNQFKNGFQGSIPKAPIEFANLAHSSNPRDRMIYLNSVYVPDNWLKLIGMLNQQVVNDNGIEQIDWQTKILDAISMLDGTNEQDVRPTPNNVIAHLKGQDDLRDCFITADNQDDYNEQVLKEQLLNEFLPTFTQFLEQGIITDTDLATYADRIRNPHDIKELSKLKKELAHLRSELEQEQSKQDVTTKIKPIEQVEHGGFITQDDARELGYVNYIYIVRGHTT